VRDAEILSETQERFLREVAARVPLDRVVEVHLFPSVRQGAIESGVAVVAAVLAAPAPAADAEQAEPAIAAEQLGDEGALWGRHTVFMARYRLHIKGRERGTWEVTVREEADAPLLTVAAVVRGVQRRSGENVDAELIGGDQLRAFARTPSGAAA